MTDKDNSTTNSRSMSSSLSDSWSMVNQDGDILDDDDSCSTASSVEVVEDDDHEDESLQTSLGASPGSLTPKGPLFVLRLSSHEVSDTDDEKNPSIEIEDNPETIPDSQSFDILTDHNKETVEDSKSEIYLEASKVHEASTSLLADKDVKYKAEEPEKDINQPSKVEEHVESLVKALHEVQSNLKPSTDASNAMSIDDSGFNGDLRDRNSEVPAPDNMHPEPDSLTVETIKSKTETEGTESHDSEDNLDTSDSTIMNQSMERNETTGNQGSIDSTDRQEPDANDEAENQAVHLGPHFGEKIRQLYIVLRDIYVQWRQGITRDALITYMCIIVAVMFLASTFTAYTILVKKEKSSKFLEEHQHMQDNYNHVQDKLVLCRKSEAKLRLELSKIDKNCPTSLQEANKIIRRWTYSSPDQLQTELDDYLTESKSFCGARVDSDNEQTKTDEELVVLERKVNTMTFLLKKTIEENSELKDSLQTTYLEISKLKASLEESEYKLAHAERILIQKSRIQMQNKERENLENDKEEKMNAEKDQEDDQTKTEEDIMLDKCVNVMLEYYRQKFKQNYKFEWLATGSQKIHEYISEYLTDTIPNNLWYFMERINLRQAHPQEPRTDNDNDEEDNDKQGTSRSSDWQDNGGGDYTDSSDNDGEDINNDGQYWSHYTGSSSGQWAETVLQMMNNTRNQLQDTWEQVKNVSETLWERHEPAITKLQKTFTRKLQNLSNKFQEKLAKKVRRWFNKEEKRKKDDKDKQFAKTSRRNEMEDDDENVNPDYTCSRKLIDLGNSILRLNAKRYQNLDNKRKILKQLKRRRRRETIPESYNGIITWLDCQIDWWSHSVSGLYETKEYQVTEKCIDAIECWQMEVSAVDQLIGRTKCRRLKRRRGNGVSVLKTACGDIVSAYDSEEETTNYKHNHHTGDETQREFDNQNRDFGSNDDDDDNDDKTPHFDPDGDTYDHDYNDNFAEGTEEEKNWYLRRAEMRGNHHSELDNGYLRRGEGDGDVENWYLRRAEMRDYHNSEPDDWYFRRHKQRQEERDNDYNDL